MSDLTSAYRRLARPWAPHELAEYYDAATRGAKPAPQREPDSQIHRPVAMLATAIPPCSSLSVAINVIHVLPATADTALLDRLLEHAETSSALALQNCHHALELDGRTHDYTADEWLPAIYDIAAALLEAANLDREPPSLVEHAEQAVSWLSRAIVDLDQDAPDAAAAIVDGLGRILTLHMFAGTAGGLGDEP